MGLGSADEVGEVDETHSGGAEDDSKGIIENHDIETTRDRVIDRKVKEGLAPKSVRYMHGVLRNALNRAIRWDYIQRNPAAHVDGPRIEQQEIQPFTREEAQQFLRVIKGDRLEALYSVALTMGLRQGEALGLRGAMSTSTLALSASTGSCRG
jgi:integrase